MLTEWRAVVGWQDAYEVSDDARVRSVPRVVMRRNGRRHTVRGGELTTHLNDGYPTVRLARTGAPARAVAVHILVAEAFIGPRPSPRHEVRHGDGVRGHCWPSNLSWGTRADNQRDAVVHGTNAIMVYNAEHRQGSCKRGHPLVAPNLVDCPSRPPEHRECRGCSWGRGKARRLRERGESYDLDQLCHTEFNKIMESA